MSLGLIVGIMGERIVFVEAIAAVVLVVVGVGVGGGGGWRGDGGRWIDYFRGDCLHGGDGGIVVVDL